MSLSALLTSFPWTRYSKKLCHAIEKLRCAGIFTKEAAEARSMQLAHGSAGNLSAGNKVDLYWLVDPDDGIIVDAKFMAYGQSALLGAAETASHLLIGKNYDQARRISSALIDQQVRDRADTAAFPPETMPHLQLVIEAIINAADSCKGLPLPNTYVTPQMPADIGTTYPEGYPGWVTMSVPEKVALIEEVLNQDIRPYIALDAGGVEVKNLINDNELLIAYQGSCTSCYSSVGTTLSYIQQVLRAKVHPSIVVTPLL